MSDRYDRAFGILKPEIMVMLTTMSNEEYFALREATILNQPSLEATYKAWIDRKTSEETKATKKCIEALCFLKGKGLLKAWRMSDSIYLKFANVSVAANRNQIGFYLERGYFSVNFIGREWKAIDTLRNASRTQLDAALKDLKERDKQKKRNEDGE